ncbi:MAG: hypothetical protein R3C40_11405 [Parvularculaceae bacterium]
MRLIRKSLAMIAAGAVLSAGASAQTVVGQTLVGHSTVYDEATRVNLGGRWVVADISLLSDDNALDHDRIRLALVTDVTKFIAETQTDLENWIAAHQERCGQRWGAGDPVIDFPPGEIRFALELELEVWNCGWNGQADPSRLAREAGFVDVTLEPFVENGRLQARLVSFAITERKGLSKFLPLEFVTSQVLNNELKKLNENKKFHQPPEPLFGEGFEYESIVGDKAADGSVVITARYKAAGGRDKIDRVIEKLRADGLTQ